MPTVSAVIATFNRSAELRQALDRLLRQTRPPDEILVIDDGSTDDTAGLVREAFPGVRYIRLPDNAGLIHARNVGLVNTAGDYILSVDDDSWFVDDDGLARTLAYAEAHPDVGAVTCNIRTRDGRIYYPRGAAPFEVPHYVGCGHLLRRGAVARVGPYIAEFRRQGEEKDRCLRLIDAGFRVMAVPDIVVYHHKSEANRSSAVRRFYDHRNDLIREIARCPTAMLPWRLARVWLGNSWKNLRDGPRATDLRVLAELPAILRIGLRHRAPVRSEAYRHWLNLCEQARAAEPMEVLARNA